LVEIAEVLATVHHAGIVHRDVKPENVHLCGERGTVLGGFGLVVAELALADADLLHGGSPYYMAPEAITRTTLRGAGHLLDLYSYGVLAYELLTGSVPYDADELDTLLRLHREAPIPDVRTRRPNVPPKLAELVAELMAKEPGARPPTAEALLWRLRAVAVDVAARPYVARPMAMVVSDDLGFAAELRNRLQHWVSGVDIVVCSSGGDALTNLAQKSTQLLLLDLQLGDIGAIELLTQLRAGKHPQPEAVVALSEHASPTDLERLRALGVRSIVPRGKMTGAMLEPVVRNVLAADEPVPERLSLV
jgi:serine/threonine protein kinase